MRWCYCIQPHFIRVPLKQERRTCGKCAMNGTRQNIFGTMLIGVLNQGNSDKINEIHLFKIDSFEKF